MQIARPFVAKRPTASSLFQGEDGIQKLWLNGSLSSNILAIYCRKTLAPCCPGRSPGEPRGLWLKWVWNTFAFFGCYFDVYWKNVWVSLGLGVKSDHQCRILGHQKCNDNFFKDNFSLEDESPVILNTLNPTSSVPNSWLGFPRSSVYKLLRSMGIRLDHSSKVMSGRWRRLGDAMKIEQLLGGTPWK